MIPEYPEYSKIDISKKTEIINFTSRFEPYSDFNFTSLLCWDINHTTEISKLNNNLVIKLADYLTGSPVISLLGENEVDQSLSKLLQTTNSLKLVPEIVINKIHNNDQFEIIEDRDNFDYIYSLENQALLEGSTFKGRRQKITRFKSRYPNYSVVELKLSDSTEIEIINAIFSKWATERDLEKEEVILEATAINNFLNNKDGLNLICVAIMVDDIPLGFSINELINSRFAFCHFQKSLFSHNDLDAVLTKHVAEILRLKGAQLVNWEQDLGIVGLRKFKESYLPIKYLKKYKVTRP